MGACLSSQTSRQQNTSEKQPLNDAKRVLQVYYRGMNQPIVFYKGTDTSEILKVIRKSFKLPNDLALDFQDENGHPLVLSGFISDGTKIHMKRSDVQTSTMSSPSSPSSPPRSNYSVAGAGSSNTTRMARAKQASSVLPFFFSYNFF